MSSARVLYNTPTLPIDMAGKSPYAAASPTYPRTTSISPPEVADSATTSGVSSTGPSFSAGSDYDSSSSGGSGIDLMDLLNDRLTGSFDPLPLDRSLATQAQT